MHIRKTLIPIFAIFLFLMTSCQGSKTAAVVTTATPGSPQIDLENYHVPDQIPQPVAGKGSVIGQLDSPDPKMLLGFIVYLGDVVKVQDKYGGFLDNTKAPSTMVDSHNGKFLFMNVTPGTYTLIIYEVGIGGKVYLDSNGSAMLVKVEAGKIQDLGKIPFNPNE